MPLPHHSTKRLDLQVTVGDSKGMMVSSLQGLLLLSTLSSAVTQSPVPMRGAPLIFGDFGGQWEYPGDGESSGDDLPLVGTTDPDTPTAGGGGGGGGNPPLYVNPMYSNPSAMYDEISARDGNFSDVGLPPGGNPEMAICDMLLGGDVPPPIDQIPWFCVCSHCKGNVGPKGDRGDRGMTGRPGSPGMRGVTGFRGPPGFRGRQGPKGQKGEEGLKGDGGRLGFTGSKGARGYKGDKGEQGLDGLQGVQGPQGEDGSCPASCDSVVGPAGEPGLPGSEGARGLPGIQGPKGFHGAKGDMGNNGVPGLPGVHGAKGDQGEQGICNCTDGADGINGEVGLRGPKGDQGDVGPQGSQGLVGEKGSGGEMGMMGMPGPCSPAIQSAFSACLAMPFPMPDLPVPFPHTHTNRQGHFDAVEGIYTAPVNGTYSFSYHLSVFAKILKVGLFHNHIPIVKTTEATNMASASHQVVLHLNQMDRVWLQVKDNNTNGMYTNTESSSTFSGFLLHPDSCMQPLGGRQGDGLWHPDTTPPTLPYSWDDPSATASPTTVS